MAEGENKALWSKRKLLLAAVMVGTLIGGVTGFGAGFLARASPASQTREFYLFPNELPFDSAVAGISHYVYIPDSIVVKRGDMVTIHFYDVTDEDHTFTIGTPYTTDVVVGAATSTVIQKADITFVATTPGIFAYHCRFHPPTMTGHLVVLLPGQAEQND